VSADTVDHLIHNVIPAATDYMMAENELTAAYAKDVTPAAWESAGRHAKRRAAELAIAIDGLTDRGASEFGISKSVIRNDLWALCIWPGSGAQRLGAHDSVRGVANAYKHQTLSDPSLPISSESDILVVGLGFGLDGFGVGKYSGVEVLVREHDGTKYKFVGDVQVAIAAWFKWLAMQGATLPAGPYVVCVLQVHP
jgi:hypothetical protein